MPHHRLRAIEPLIKKCLSYSPCVGLVGMRQTGKSTLLKKFSKVYRSFDDWQLTTEFENEGAALLEMGEYPLALDEIQKYPPVFDAIKFSVDEQKKPGRFLVSGSVRFSQKQDIRESLTGRLALLEIFPFSLAECHQKPNSIFLESILTKSPESFISQLSKKAWATNNDLLHYMKTGGLPGISFKRDEHIRNRMFNDHLDTLLGRDIQMIRKIRLPLKKLRSFVTELAGYQGLPTNVSHLARLVGTSVPTAKQILEALEGIFLVRPYGNTHFIEDAGLSHFLKPLSDQLTRVDRIRCLYYELRLQMTTFYKHEGEMNPYQTRGGVEIPFLISLKSGKKIALTFDDSERPSEKSLKGLGVLKQKFPEAVPLALIDAPRPLKTAGGINCIPWTWVYT